MLKSDYFFKKSQFVQTIPKTISPDRHFYFWPQAAPLLANRSQSLESAEDNRIHFPNSSVINILNSLFSISPIDGTKNRW